MLEAAAEPTPHARAHLGRELVGLEKLVRDLGKEDPVCRLPMTMPGVGHVMALSLGERWASVRPLACRVLGAKGRLRRWGRPGSHRGGSRERCPAGHRSSCR